MVEVEGVVRAHYDVWVMAVDVELQRKELVQTGSWEVAAVVLQRLVVDGATRTVEAHGSVVEEVLWTVFFRLGKVAALRIWVSLRFHLPSESLVVEGVGVGLSSEHWRSLSVF